MSESDSDVHEQRRVQLQRIVEDDKLLLISTSFGAVENQLGTNAARTMLTMTKFSRYKR